MTKSEGQVCMGQYLCCIGTGFSSRPDPNIWSGGRGQGPKLSNPARATLTNPVWPNSWRIGDSAAHTSEYFSEFSEFSIFCTHHLGKGTLGQKGREMGQTAILFCLCLVIGQVSLATIIMGVIFVCIKFRDSTKNHFHMMKHTFAFFHVGMTILPATKWGN